MTAKTWGADGGLTSVQVIRSFREQHSSVPKSWIERHVKEDACHTGACWTIKPDVLAAYGQFMPCHPLHLHEPTDLSAATKQTK